MQPTDTLTDDSEEAAAEDVALLPSLPRKPRAGQPSPAVLEAAQQRRRARHRRRVRRIALLVISIAVVALAGPPAARWIADGFDTADPTETGSPAAGMNAD